MSARRHAWTAARHARRIARPGLEHESPCFFAVFAVSAANYQRETALRRRNPRSRATQQRKEQRENSQGPSVFWLVFRSEWPHRSMRLRPTISQNNINSRILSIYKFLVLSVGYACVTFDLMARGFDNDDIGTAGQGHTVPWRATLARSGIADQVGESGSQIVPASKTTQHLEHSRFWDWCSLS